MIFVTTGSQKFPFDRLIRAADQVAGENQSVFFAQIGTANYLPRHMDYRRFLDRTAFQEAIASCDVLITHAAAGTMASALHRSKKIIAVPRLSEYGEHIDDHQAELAEELAKGNYLFCLNDLEQLGKTVCEVQNHVFDSYVSSPESVFDLICRAIGGDSKKGQT